MKWTKREAVYNKGKSVIGVARGKKKKRKRR
jgi:hypothetical protein